MRILMILVALCGASCVATRDSVPPIGTARASSDFATYDIRRVGVMPPHGEGLDPELAGALRDALAAAFTAETRYELVALTPSMMEAVATLEPARTGRTRPEAVLDLARRASLDAVMSVCVTDLRPYEPVRLSLEIDLIVVETGLTTWSCTVQVDTGDALTRESIAIWQHAVRGGDEAEHAVDFLSPRRIAEYAAAQAAMLL